MKTYQDTPQAAAFRQSIRTIKLIFDKEGAEESKARYFLLVFLTLAKANKDRGDAGGMELIGCKLDYDQLLSNPKENILLALQTETLPERERVVRLVNSLTNQVLTDIITELNKHILWGCGFDFEEILMDEIKLNDFLARIMKWFANK